MLVISNSSYKDHVIAISLQARIDYHLIDIQRICSSVILKTPHYDMLIIFQVYCSIENFSVQFYACLKEGNVTRLGEVLEIVTRAIQECIFQGT